VTLPLIDEHTVAVNASPAEVFTATERYATALAGRSVGLLGVLLGTRPPSGFAMSTGDSRVELTGQHRFSRYRLEFLVTPGRLTARSFGEFPGPHGRLYRLLVVSSGAHVAAVRRMLTSISSAAPSGR
jgi:hypothetical protein